MLKLSESKTVLALSAPFRAGGAAAELPQRVRLLAWGENIGRTTGARIVVDDQALALAANQELVAVESVPLDYEHQSHKGHPNYLPDPRHSPGAGRIEVVAGDGVYLSAISYTPNGLQFAAGYQDVSAVVHLDKHNRPLWISSVALTQQGDVSGMEFAEAVAALSARSLSHTPNMENNAAQFRSLLVKLLKLPDDATDEQIVAAVETAPAAQDPAMKAETTEALSARLTALETTNTALSARLDGQDRQALVERATREGKVIPLSAELIEQTPVAVLGAMIDKLPAGEVNLETSGNKEKPADKVVALSADQQAAAKALGLTDEEYRKGKA